MAATRRKDAKPAMTAPRKSPKTTALSSFPIHVVAEILKEETKKLPLPIVTEQVRNRRDPFKVLISTMISLRTKDEVTAEASLRLYALADRPETLKDLPAEVIEKAIYPAGFYKTKAENIRRAAARIVEEYGGKVPEEIDELVRFQGVGRKTANLVRTLGYGLPGICVDTHVHRITNRWGYVQTANPDKTEMRLREILPEEYWIPINDWLVAYGQHLCAPVSPWCSRCRIASYCARVGVKRSR